MYLILVTKKRKLRIDLAQLAYAMLIIVGITFLLCLSVDFAMSPEKYLTTWR